MKYLFHTEALGGYMLQSNPHKRHLKTETQGEGEDFEIVPLNEIRESDLEFDSATETLRIVNDEIVVVARPPDPVIVPESVTRRGLRKALLDDGITFADIRLRLEGITDAAEREDALIDLDDAQTIHRDHPLVAGIGAMLSKTSEQLDGYFILARTLDS